VETQENTVVAKTIRSWEGSPCFKEPSTFNVYRKARKDKARCYF